MKKRLARVLRRWAWRLDPRTVWFETPAFDGYVRKILEDRQRT